MKKNGSFKGRFFVLNDTVFSMAHVELAIARSYSKIWAFCLLRQSLLRFYHNCVAITSKPCLCLKN